MTSTQSPHPISVPNPRTQSAYPIPVPDLRTRSPYAGPIFAPYSDRKLLTGFASAARTV
jgi:hypothetical protein